MKLKELSPAELQTRLAAGLSLQVGEYVVRVSSTLPSVAAGLGLLYADFDLAPGAFADFPIEIAPRRALRRKFAPEAVFLFDGARPFLPLPRPQAYAFFEWALNWCVANHVLDRLVLHAAVVERGGRALVLAGAPGSGKSTLCAALVVRGWRLLSDEFGLAKPGGASLTPLPRPVSLKNASIELIRARAPEVALSPPVMDTHKGVISHMRPPTSDVERMAEPATAQWLLFPRFEQGAKLRLAERQDVSTFAGLVENAFNYSVLGETGFRTAAALVHAARGYDLTFGDLDDACAAVEDLARAGKAAALA